MESLALQEQTAPPHQVQVHRRRLRNRLLNLRRLLLLLLLWSLQKLNSTPTAQEFLPPDRSPRSAAPKSKAGWSPGLHLTEVQRKTGEPEASDSPLGSDQSNPEPTFEQGTERVKVSPQSSASIWGRDWFGRGSWQDSWQDSWGQFASRADSSWNYHQETKKPKNRGIKRKNFIGKKIEERRAGKRVKKLKPNPVTSKRRVGGPRRARF